MPLKNVKLGKNTFITDESLVNLYGCKIGDNTKIGPFVEIQKNAIVGKNCKISSHTFICEGVEIKDNVFVGHNVTFINDKMPGAVNNDGNLKTDKDWKLEKTIINEGVSIGSGSTILCGIEIGVNTMIGAGSVVTKNIKALVTAYGNPAKKKMNIGLIGIGYWGPNLFRNLIESKNFKVKYVCDIRKDNLKKINIVGKKIVKTTDYKDLISDKSIDAILLPRQLIHTLN